MAGIRHGPAPQPTELKRLRGNPGKRALPAPIVALAPVVPSDVIPAPRSGRELAERIRASHASAWVAETDHLLLMPLVEANYDRWLALSADIAVNGVDYESVSRLNGVQRHMRPAVQLLLATEKNLTTWLQLLGFSPTDRSRLGVAELQSRKTAMQLLREEVRARAAGRQAS